MTTRILLWAALGAVSCGSAYAAPPPGRLLAAQCAQCHGTDGRSVSGIDSLIGEDDLYGELVEMRTEPGANLMHLQARGYTDEQLRQISEYFATQGGAMGGAAP